MSPGDLILITRPQKEAAQECALLGKYGYNALAEPMLEIFPRPFIVPAFTVPDCARYQGFIFTSANGVESFAQKCAERRVPAYVVGRATGEAVRAYGFETLYVSEGTSADLAALIIKNAAAAPQSPFLYLRGDHVAGDLAEDLEEVGLHVDSLIVYESRVVPAFSKHALTAIKDGHVRAISFYSRRTALNFVTLAVQADIVDFLKSIRALCVSQSVLECLQSLPWRGMHTTARADREAMAFLIQDLFPK